MSIDETIAVAPTKETAQMGGLTDETEDFPWHHDIAQKPAKLVIYPYRAGPKFQAEILAQLEKANADNQAHLNLSNKESSLAGELLAFDDDEFLSDREIEEKLKVVEALNRVRAKLKQLDGVPRTANEVIADWFVLMIKSHNLVDGGMKPLPLTREGYLSIADPAKFQKLYDDLSDFLSKGRNRRKRV